MDKFARWLPGTSAKPNDNRGGRLVLAIECILNQNARDLGAAVTPAMNEQVLALCQRYQIGILQLPCPEIHVLGFERKRPTGESIRATLDTSGGREACAMLSRELADRAETYMKQGFDVLAVLGGNAQSPGCAVHPVDGGSPSRLSAESGVFLKALSEEFSRRGFQIPFLPLRDADGDQFQSDLARLEALLRQ